MPKSFLALLACFSIASAFAADEVPPADTATQAVTMDAAPNSKQIEEDLQHLPWKQFKSVIESIPRMKADVDAYGVLGWNYVQANYKTYAWKRNIDRLDLAQRTRLVDLIRVARSSNAPTASPTNL